MIDLNYFKNELIQNDYSFILTNGNEKISSKEKGLKPIIDLIESKKDFSDYILFDKITGRAAAFLYVLLGIEKVHSTKMSRLAIQILDRAQIDYSYDNLIETVLDSKLKDVDPVELSVLRSGSPIQAIEDIKRQIEY